MKTFLLRLQIYSFISAMNKMVFFLHNNQSVAAALSSFQSVPVITRPRLEELISRPCCCSWDTSSSKLSCSPSSSSPTTVTSHVSRLCMISSDTTVSWTEYTRERQIQNEELRLFPRNVRKLWMNEWMNVRVHIYLVLFTYFAQKSAPTFLPLQQSFSCVGASGNWCSFKLMPLLYPHLIIF